MSARVGILEDIEKTSNVQRPTSNAQLDCEAVAAVYGRRRRLHSAAIAGWRETSLSARSVNPRPGGILCQGDAPEGCGNGIRLQRWPARMTRNLRPITSSSFAQPMNCTIANRPTGIMRRGRKIRISSSIHNAQLRISSGAGTRSVPPEFLPGKQRQTAAK